jgi:hypothetical protein
MNDAAIPLRMVNGTAGGMHTATPRLPVGAVIVLSSAGVLVTAIGFAAGRSGAPNAMVWYWLGQALVFIPILLRVFAGRLRETQAFALVMALAVNGYAIKWAFSPDQLRFGDELQHWVATGTLLRTGRLFQPNDALPVAVHYPGLEEMGAAVTRLTGFPITTSALVVAGILHLILVGAIFMLVRRCGGGPTLAALTCVIYATGLHYLFFDSMYVYQTAALPFLLLALWAVRRGDIAAATVSIIMVTVTHHVTGVVLVGTLIGLAILDRRRTTAIAAGIATACVGGWIALVAPEVLSYLGQPASAVLGGIRSFAGGGQPSGAGGSAAWVLVVQAVGVGGLFVTFVVALRFAYRNRMTEPWRVATLIGAGLFFVGGVLRVLSSSGPELVARAGTFSYIPLAVVAAAVLLRWRLQRPAIRWPSVISVALIALLATGARLGGWPPSWELVPGGYVAAGYERAVEPLGVAAATWMATDLGPGNRVAADLTGWTLASTYGRQDPVGNVARLYDDPVWTDRDIAVNGSLAIRYVWVDTRLADHTPPGGSLFTDDPRAGKRTTPLARERLAKFDAVPGLSRVFDNGAIRIYQVGPVAGGPSAWGGLQ